MNNKLVSVIVPIYNVEKYLARCIESIIRQTYTNIEIILVNDGSTDNCGEICKHYAHKDKRIKIVEKKNGGLSDARNAGLKIATGEYVIFVDSDDYIEEELISDTYSKIVENDADICYFNYNQVDEQGNLIEKNILNFEDELLLIEEGKTDEYLVTCFFTYKHGIEAWDKMYKMKIIRDNGLTFTYNHEIFAEDLLFNLCYLIHVRRIVALNISYYNYVIRSDSIMGLPKKDLFKRYLELFTRLELYWNDNNSNMNDLISLGYFIWLITTFKIRFNENVKLRNISREFKSISGTKKFKKMRNDILSRKILIKYIKLCPQKRKHAVLLYIIALLCFFRCEYLVGLLLHNTVYQRRPT